MDSETILVLHVPKIIAKAMRNGHHKNGTAKKARRKAAAKFSNYPEAVN